jgi:AraC-like DNA-binding protein
MSVSYTSTQYKGVKEDYLYVDLIKTKMEQEKLYLRQNLTLERLAEVLSISTKDLSKTINGYYQKNFFEFISYYRVEEAKSLLVKKPNLSIQSVLEQSGFRSKSAFNRFFLKYVLETPSDFRKRHI